MICFFPFPPLVRIALVLLVAFLFFFTFCSRAIRTPQKQSPRIRFPCWVTFFPVRLTVQGLTFPFREPSFFPFFLLPFFFPLLVLGFFKGCLVGCFWRLFPSFLSSESPPLPFSVVSPGRPSRFFSLGLSIGFSFFFYMA